MNDPGSIPMDDPLAYFMTWTTYGTWLPGDQRGWVQHGKGFQPPDAGLQTVARSKLTESPCHLSDDHRHIVQTTIADHCKIRGWTLLAANCRSNHVHAVVNGHASPDKMMDEFKAWCTRKLKKWEQEQGKRERKKWWTEKGSIRMLNDMSSVEAAVVYVVEGQ